MSFPELAESTPTTTNVVRLKRQLAEQAVNAATNADWQGAADLNRRILEMGPDVQAENRLAKALWELGELGEAREHYQTALALDPTNRIAERNIERLRYLLLEAGERTVAADPYSKAPVNIFIEETGKIGFAMLVELAPPRQLTQVNPGDRVDLLPEGDRLIAVSDGIRIGVVEPKVAARLLKLVATGNGYTARITSLGDADVRIIIRETYQDPRNYGKVSFPTAAKASDLRPYTKGTLVREELELEEDLEFDEEDETLEDIDRVVPAQVTEDDAFEAEPGVLEEEPEET